MTLRTSVYLRTHCWDEATDLCFRRANEALGGGLKVSADMTRPFTVPHDVEVLPHGLEVFSDWGFPLLPSPERTFWYNGDYVFYQLAREDDADFFLMFDGDCCVNGFDLRGFIDRMMAESVDFCAPWVADCAPGVWTYFADIQRNWFDAELGPDHGAQAIKSFFPIVFMSRRAIEHLLQRRLAMAKALQSGVKATWPICESFAPSEVGRMPGAVMRNMSDMNLGPMHMSFRDPYGIAELDGLNKRLVHPLLSGKRLGEKIVYTAQSKAPKDRDAQISMLQNDLLRPLEPEALEVVRASLQKLQT